MSFGQVARLGFTAVGAYFGGPAGAMIGSTIGGALFPEQLPDINGQKLGDMQMTSSSYGAPIPIVYGTVRMATTILWTSGRKATKHKETEGGKGGPEQTTTYFTYSLDAAFAICEGPITGVKRIWINSRLVFDSGSAETQLNVDLGGGALVDAVTVYTGAEDQQPSALHESYEGVGLVPAYRGLAIVEFDNLQLGEFGNGMVNIEVEVTAGGSVSSPLNIVHSLTTNIDNVRSLVMDEGTIVHSTVTADSTVTGHVTIMTRDLYGELLRSKEYAWENSPENSAEVSQWVSYCKNDPFLVISQVGSPWYNQMNVYWYGFADTTGAGNLVAFASTYWTQRIDNYPDAGSYWSDSGETIRLGNKYYITAIGEGVDTWLRVYAIDPVTLGPTGHLVRQYTWAELGLRQESTDHYHLFPDAAGRDYFWVIHDELSLYDEVSLFDFDFNLISQWHANDTLGVNGHGGRFISTDGWFIQDSGAFSVRVLLLKFDPWTSNSKWELISDQFLQGGSEYGDFVSLNDRWVISKKTLHTIDDVVTIGNDTVANIVEDQCARVGITSVEVDTTGLSKSVAGYFLSTNMSARNALETLQLVGFFDVAEVDGKIVCTERGGASQGVIPQADLAAVVGGGHRDDFEIRRRGELELPRKVSVTYMNPDDDYLTNTQTSERLTVRGDGVQNAQVPIVLQDEDAMVLTDAMLYQHYAERESVTFFLSTKHIKIAPNDVWTVGNSGYRIRIETVTQDIVGVLTIKGVIELTSETYTIVRDTAFVSSATPVAGITGPTITAYMNLPWLRENDDASGVYVAGAGVYSAWEGYTLMVSDDGSTYNDIDTFIQAADFGTTTEILASAATTHTWDYAVTLNVRPVNNMVLASDTEINVMNGANAAAVGTEGGNWEIIQWVTASAEADGTYTLSQLLRGVKGTEFATDTHITSEDFVVLNEDGGVRFVTTDEAFIDVARWHKTVTIGTTEQATTADRYTDTGGPLRPYSPAMLRGERIGTASATVSFTWKRRSRYNYDTRYVVIVGEDTELYSVDFYDTASTLLRTVSTVKSSVAYTSAERVADGASAGATIITNVFQISATVGRGHPAVAQI